MNEQPRSLSHEPADVHVAELERALAAGELDVATLIERLADPDWVRRRALVNVLAGLGDAATPELLAALESRRDDEARIAAMVDALSASSGELDKPLAVLAELDDAAVVADVASILGRRHSRRGVPLLIKLTKHTDDNVAVAAIEALGRIGGQSAVEALVACVGGNNFFRVFPAIDVLGRSGDPRAIAPLAQLLDNPRYAFEAARALGRSADRAAVAPLLKLAQASSEASVRVACAALSELCERHAERYGEATAIEELLREARQDGLVRRLGQMLSAADRSEKIAICRVLGALQGGAAVQWILPLLDGEPEVARAASRALDQMGRDTSRALDEALLAPHSARRAVLLPTLMRREHAPAVLACLQDPEPQVRALAADALARLDHRAATPQLFALLADDSARVVIAASAAIQALAANQTESLALEAARSALPGVRRAALRVLAYFGYESALDTFVQALTEPDPRLRDAAAQGLSLLHSVRARDVLLETAAHADEKARAAAVRALGQREGDDATRACLLHALHDADAWVRYYACQALGRQRDSSAIDAIAALLRDDAGQVRVAAVEALSHLKGAVALDALRTAARDDDLDVRRAGLLGLGLSPSGPAHPDSLPILLAAARADDASTRLVALSALAQGSAPEVIAALAEAARDQDEAVRTAAIGFLQTGHGEPPSDALIELARSSSERTRALEALATPSVPPEARVTTLLRALSSADDELSPLLVSCLSRLQRSERVPALIQALALDNRSARMAAAHGLSALGTREAFAALARAAIDDPDAEVRRVCALHLAG